MSTKDFAYFLNTKKHIVVASFTGSITSESTATLETCLAEISTLSCEFVVLNFAAVGEVDRNVYSAFVKFQAAVRELEKNLLLCAVPDALKKTLEQDGVIRTSELVGTLMDALQKVMSFSSQKKAS